MTLKQFEDPIKSMLGIASVIPVGTCIAYIEGCGWLLKSRARGYYYFRNENAAVGMRDKTFSLAELRSTYKTGW